jgi:hypothetical protein
MLCSKLKLAPTRLFVPRRDYADKSSHEYRREICHCRSLPLLPHCSNVGRGKGAVRGIELGAGWERSIQDRTFSYGPSASVEFPVIKDWLEIETGISPLFRPGQTEWQADLLFKKPFTINEHLEFMVGAGPQLSYATAGGGTKIASEVALEWMIWPTKDRKFGWFVEPTYSYSFSRGHEQAIGVTGGLTIAIY